MTSTIKVNNIQNACGTNIIKRCGTTTTVGSGASNPIVVCGSAVTIGRCSGTVALASGATQTGFGRTGTVDWNTTKKTADFTATNGDGFFVDTSGGSNITVTLPSSPSAGNIVAIADYAGTAATNKIIIARNGSNIQGVASNAEIATNREARTLVYVDATQGWVAVNNNEDSVIPPAFVTATGGTITTVCTNFKVHTFTGPGTFCVSCAGNADGSNTVDYLVIAGGGGGGSDSGAGGGLGVAGGGAGGYRESSGAASGCYTASPLGACVSALPVSVQGYPIAVGGGGASNAPQGNGSKGVNSTFSTITSAGGGGGMGNPNSPTCGADGGSGGGGTFNETGGVGNSPPVSPAQGQNGEPGTFSGSYPGGGGGGAGEAGGSDGDSQGGDGLSSSINGSPTTRSGGGAGGFISSGGATGGSGGGGPAGGPGGTGTAGSANTGGGGGGSGGNGGNGAAGGSGVVIIRYKFQ